MNLKIRYNNWRRPPQKWSDYMAQKYSIQLLTASTSEWNASQYVVPKGELIAELQTDGKIQLKIGLPLSC